MLELEILVISFIMFFWVTCALQAFDGLSGGRIRKLEVKHPKFAEKLSRWLERSDSLKGVFRLILFICSALIGIFTYIAADEYFAEMSKIRTFIIPAIVLIASSVVAEITARILVSYSDVIVLRITMPLLNLLANTVFMPAVLLANYVRKMTEGWKEHADKEIKTSAEDEILSFVDSYGDSRNDDLEEGEKRMIRGILDLDDMSVREIMTPRVDLVSLPASATISEAKKLFIETGHSRIPIYGRTVDEIKGLIFAKDFIDEDHIRNKTLDQLAHKPIFIPETKAVGDLLEEIKRSRNHFAVIIDEYGGTSGIVTFEDIIEEIVGEVGDEYDQEEDNKAKPQLMPDGSIVFEARTLICDVNEILESEIPDNDSADTIGGYICSEIGRIPDEGETLKLPNRINAFIMKADKRKILQIRLSISDEDED